MKALFLTQGPVEDASARFRAYQYVRALGDMGLNCSVSPAVDSDRYHLVFRETIVDRAELAVRTLSRRAVDILRARDFDVVIVCRPILSRFFPAFETLMHIMRVPIVFDVDDNVFDNPARSSDLWYRIARRGLEDRRAAERVARMASVVVVGSNYLAKRTRPFNPQVRVIPTSIDVATYPIKRHYDIETPTVGWVGSPSTTPYLQEWIEPLVRLAARRDFRLLLVGADPRASSWFGALPHVELAPWSLSQETDNFARIDVGLMPMPEDDWTRGKCAFKAIQYMGSGIPAVCSPVGASPEIIEDGVDGFLPASPSAVESILDELVASARLRACIGTAARATVSERYSLAANAPRLADSLLLATR